ncbi:MAG: AI-2E family transporter, partial [Stellaceae bacterium]
TAPTLREQVAELRLKLPEAIDRVQDWVDKRESGMLGVLFGSTPKGTAPAGATAGPASAPAPGATAAVASPAAVDSSTAGGIVPDTATSGQQSLASRLHLPLDGVSHYLFPFARSTLAAVGGFLLIVFLSIYFAADPDLYRRGALALLPARRRRLGAEVMDRVAVVLRKWLVTQLVAMAVIGSVSTIVLLVLHVKAAFLLGILAGLFEFIPTVGPIFSSIPAIAMGFLDSPEKALFVAVAYIGIQFLENHILIPLLMKGGMNLPPALTVLTQALLALVFGFLGLMVAVPMLATVMVIVQMLYVEARPEESGADSHDEGEGGFDPDLDEPLGVIAHAGG